MVTRQLGRDRKAGKAMGEGACREWRELDSNIFPCVANAVTAAASVNDCGITADIYYI